ncbi:hypothetical protein BDV37DRAFT_265577 [Aspergillus pseudonomiae]|uniref:Uncharacterized protein n=1 Tax=Aspergillus pseudonomiae TaxID=1506151 RepID=A0A5N7CTD8_9EURO|nr:uncharacterized protein BDV37DRAFT_265577 [Aspergillus pseudonomiae]KAE8397471.1 hypothetical protein BDV37DRAFT_265577 [Aspergillus pseudonomiae]
MATCFPFLFHFPSFFPLSSFLFNSHSHSLHLIQDDPESKRSVGTFALLSSSLAFPFGSFIVRPSRPCMYVCMYRPYRHHPSTRNY